VSSFTSTQIGDLLSSAGLVGTDNVEAALALSRSRKEPLGKTLIDSGLLTETELNGALQAQNLIREKFLEQDVACRLLGLMRDSGQTFVSTLFSEGVEIEQINFSRALGKLFMDAGAITPQNFYEALEISILSGLPVVRVLVVQNSLSEMVAYAGLTALLLVREKKIGYDQAVGALRLSHMHNEHIEEILEFGGLKRYRAENLVRLGELLVLAELISELDLLSCVEKSMSEAKPLGQVLVDHGVVSEQLVASALRAQKYIVSGTIDPLRASQMLRHCAKTGRPLEFSVEELAALKPVAVRLSASSLVDVDEVGGDVGSDNDLDKAQVAVSFVDLIELLGIITLDELEQVRIVEQNDPERLLEFILSRDFVDGAKLEAASVGYKLVESGMLTAEQLVFVYHVWLWRRGPFNDTLNMLGWKA
jgi:hypothetical protein